ncbi:MAG: putative Co/Zn/Cd efflux system rane fusion protein [Myxococcaceae bacterium]|nr:putative Co/Zn/Cd efflux system rane fusion protein [Myxococcaceae bacterium]
MNKRPGHVLICLLALAGCKREKAVEAKPEQARAHVQTVVAAKKPVPQEVTLTGVLIANERTELAANASGRVLRVFVELGQRVVAGAPIAQLDARTAVLAAREASANVQTAVEQLSASQKDCERYKRLLAKGAITQQEYDRAIGQCQTQGSSELAARVRVEQANQTLSDATVRAPFAGKIAERNVHVGDYVRPDSKVVTLLADDPLRLRLTVSEHDIVAVKPGTEVRFETSGIPDRTFRATIKYIGGEVREQTRDLVAEALVDNHDGALLPGMFVTAHLATGVSELPVLPKNALVAGATTPNVFVVEGDRLRQRIVQVGPPVGDELSILDGIRVGEHVVLDPSNTLSDGALVD